MNQKKLLPQRQIPWALRLGLGCFLMGIVDMWLLLSLGLEFSVSGRDATLVMGSFIAISFGIFGSLLGMAISAKKRARRTAEDRRDSLMRLAEVQGRVAQMEKMAALGQVVASIAHEVRNPLAIVGSHVQNLNEEVAAGAHPDPRDFEIILEELDRLARVVVGIGHFARPIQPCHISVSTGEIVERVRFMTDALYKDRRVETLSVTSASTHDGFNGDPDLICQALMVLIVNAVEANPPDQPVRLYVDSTAEKIFFEIVDQGPGIPEEMRARVFEPFYTTKPSGNGLGLAIAQQIAEALGGLMKIGDGPGGGARLCLCLPRNISMSQG